MFEYLNCFFFNQREFLIMENTDTNKLALLNLVNVTRNLVGNRNLIVSLYELSKAEWDRSFNEGTQEHFIKGVANANTKTDAVRNYVGKVVRLYLNTIGNTNNAWTKNSISNDHVFATLITNKLTTNVYQDNESLFIDLATRLLGYDPEVVKFAINHEDGGQSAFYLIKYLVCYLDLISRNFEDKDQTEEKFEDEIKQQFAPEIGIVKQLLNKEEFNDNLFMVLYEELLDLDEYENDLLETFITNL